MSEVDAEDIGRTVGIDLGSKRVGIAVSDGRGVLASPLIVLDRSGDWALDHQRIAALADEEEARRIVVGLPVDLRGIKALAANAVLEEIEAMRFTIHLPIETWDERMTSVAAHKAMRAQNISERKRRGQIDKWAAAVMLQGWLDSRTSPIKVTRDTARSNQR